MNFCVIIDKNDLYLGFPREIVSVSLIELWIATIMSGFVGSWAL